MTRPIPRIVRRRLFGTLMAASVVLAGGWRAQAQNPDVDKRFLEEWAKQPRVKIAIPPGPAATVVIVKFNDYMCPGCKAWNEIMKPLLAKYQATPGAIRFVEKDWPWNIACNSGTKQTFVGHEASCAAAAAVRLAADRGKRAEMAEWLYAHQPETPAARKTALDEVKAHASAVLGIKDFVAAYMTKLPDIQRDVADGMAVGINSTPMYYINGVKTAQADGSMIPLHYVELAIQQELGRKK